MTPSSTRWRGCPGQRARRWPLPIAPSTRSTCSSTTKRTAALSGPWGWSSGCRRSAPPTTSQAMETRRRRRCRWRSPSPRRRAACERGPPSCSPRSAPGWPGARPSWSGEAAMPEGCALVTGSARGIGAASAKKLAEAGWPVAINYRSDAEGAEGVAAAIGEAGGQAAAVQADVRDPDAVGELFRSVEERFGPVLVVVNNAGVRADGLAPQLGDDEWERVLETNLSAAFRVTRRALKPMLRARFGRVINIASVVGLRANAGQANYAASKAGLIGFTKTVAVEVARRGVTVNAVAPGFVETQLTDGAGNGLVESIPARRAGTAEEIASCVRFLASDEASYVTGTTLTVDGGLSA